jgi:hypothetical protein
VEVPEVITTSSRVVRKPRAVCERNERKGEGERRERKEWVSA